MLAIGSLSEAAFGLRRKLVDNISGLDNDISRIKIGHPGSNLKDLEDADENGLNLFFYHINYDGYPADGGADNPFYVRLYCLITAIGYNIKKTAPGNTEGRDISKGENELRLIGEVMSVLHKHAIFTLSDADSQEIATLQVVPHSLDMDTLNHIWGTQGSETPYRLSVAYELSLAPIPYGLPTNSSPLVGDPQMLVWGRMERDEDKEREGIIDLKPQVGYVAIDTSMAEWAPHIALVETHADSRKTLQYVSHIAPPLDRTLDILLAGDEGAEIRLYWRVWRRKDDNTVVAWKEDIADVETAQTTIENDSSGDPFYPNRIDPASIDARRVVQVRLPVDVAQSDTKTWQAMLYVERNWEHEDPEDSGTQIVTAIRSNTVLLYGDSS